MADDGATFVFDTNIEDVVSRIVTGLQQVQKTVNSDGGAGTSRLTSNLPRDIGIIVGDAQAQIDKLNKALSSGTLKGSLTKGYQGVVTDLNKAIGRITAGRGLSLDVGLKFATGPIKELIKSLQTQLVAAANSTNKVISAKAGTGVLQNRRIDFDAGAKAGDEANKEYAKQVRKRADQVARSARFAQIAADEDSRAAVFAKDTRRNRGREADSTKKIADTAFTEAEKVSRAARDAQTTREQIAAEQEKTLRLAREANARAQTAATTTPTAATSTTKRATIPAQTTAATASARLDTQASSTRSQTVGDAAKIQAFNSAIARANAQFERGIFGPGQLETQLTTIRDRFNQIAQNVSGGDGGESSALAQQAARSQTNAVAGAILGADAPSQRSGDHLTREDLLDLLSTGRGRSRTTAGVLQDAGTTGRRPPEAGGAGGLIVRPRNPSPPVPVPAAASLPPRSIPDPRVLRENANRVREFVASTQLARASARQYEAHTPNLLLPEDAQVSRERLRTPAVTPQPFIPIQRPATSATTLLPFSTPASITARYEALLHQVGASAPTPPASSGVLDTLLGRPVAGRARTEVSLADLVPTTSRPPRPATAPGNRGLSGLLAAETNIPAASERNAFQRGVDFVRERVRAAGGDSGQAQLFPEDRGIFRRRRPLAGQNTRDNQPLSRQYALAHLLPDEIVTPPVQPGKPLTSRERQLLSFAEGDVYDGSSEELPPEFQELRKRADAQAQYQRELASYLRKNDDPQAPVRRRIAADRGRVTDRPDFRVEDDSNQLGRLPELYDNNFPTYRARVGPQDNPIEVGSITTMNEGPLRAIRMLHVQDEFHRQGVATEMYNFGRLASQRQLGRSNPNGDPLFNDLYHSDNLTSMGYPFAMNVGGPVAYGSGGIGDATRRGIVRRDPATLPDALQGPSDYYEDKDSWYKEKLKREKEEKLYLEQQEKEKRERKEEDAHDRADLFHRAALLRDRPARYAGPDALKLPSRQVASGELDERTDALARASNLFGAHTLRGTTLGQTALPLPGPVTGGLLARIQATLRQDPERGSAQIGPSGGRFLGIPLQRSRSGANARDVTDAADRTFERAERLQRAQDAFDAIPFQEQSKDRRVAPPVNPFSPFPEERRRVHAARRDQVNDAGPESTPGIFRVGDRPAFIPIPRRNDPDFDTHDFHRGDNVLPATSPGRFAALDRFLQAIDNLRKRLPERGDDRGSAQIGPSDGTIDALSSLGGRRQPSAETLARIAENAARHEAADDQARIERTAEQGPPRVIRQRVRGANLDNLDLLAPQRVRGATNGQVGGLSPEEIAQAAEEARLARNEKQRAYRARRRAEAAAEAAAAAGGGAGGGAPPKPPTGGGGSGGDDGGETPEEERLRLEAERAAAAAKGPRRGPGGRFIPKNAGASGGSGSGGGKGGGTATPPPDDDEPDEPIPVPKKKRGPNKKSSYLTNLSDLTTGEGDARRLADDVIRISDKYVAHTRDNILRIFRQTNTGFNSIAEDTPLFVTLAGKVDAKLAAAEAKAKAILERTEREAADKRTADTSRKNKARLTEGVDEEGEFTPGVERIGNSNSFVADTRDAQTRIYKQTADGFEEIAKGTAQFDSLARRLRNQQEARGRGGIVDSFIRGATSGSAFGGGSGGGRPSSFSDKLDGLARSAGTTAKYAVLGSAFYALQSAVAAAGAEVLDFADSYTELNIALEGGLPDGAKDVKASQVSINELADSASLAGTNVGEAMDQAASAVRAFKNTTADGSEASQSELEALGVTFAAEASKIATITKTTLTDAGGNLKATALAFDIPVSGLSRITDVLAGAKQVGGGNEKDIGQGIASAAVAAKEAGFSLEETGVLISRIVAETDESGAAAATRFSKITAILGGSAGKAALIKLNDTLQPSQQIDTSADIKTQVQQLSQVYDSLNDGQRQALINSLGGTANARELIVLLSSANDLIKQADAGFTGKGAEEYERRLKDIRAVLTQITGNLKNLVVALANSGIAAPFGLLVKDGLLPALELVRHLAEAFNLIPAPIRKTAFLLGEVLAVMLAIRAVAASGGLREFLAGAEEFVAPGRTVSRRANKAAKGAKAAKAAKETAEVAADAAVGAGQLELDLGLGAAAAGGAAAGKAGAAGKVGRLAGLGTVGKVGLGAAGIAGVLAAVALFGQSVYTAGKKIDQASGAFERLSKAPEKFTVASLRDSSLNLATNAHQLNDASSGFFGTLANQQSDTGGTGILAKAATEEARFQSQQATRLERAQTAARQERGTRLGDTIDLSTPESLSASLEGLQGAGRNATTQMRALLDAMDQLGTGSVTASNRLTELQRITISGQVGTAFQVHFNDSLAKQRETALDSQIVAPAYAGLGQVNTTVNKLKRGAGNVASFGIAPLLRRRDNKVGRFLRNDREDAAFDLGKVDSQKLSTGITDVTNNFLRDKANPSIDTKAGKDGLKAIYLEFFKKNFPDIKPAERDALIADALQQTVAAYKSVAAPRADLQEKIGNALAAAPAAAQKAAEEAGTAAALGKGNDGQALASARANLNTLVQARQDAVNANAAPARLEQIDQDIAAARVQYNSGLQGRAAQTQALTLSKIPQESTSARNQSAIDALNTQLGIDPKTGKRQFHYVDKKIASTQHFNEHTGKVEGVAEHTERTKVFEGPTLDAGQRDEANAARNDAIAAQQAQKVKDKAAKRRAKIDPRDEVGNAAADTKDAQAEVDRLKANGTKGEALDTAALNLTKAQQAEASTRVDAAIAQRNVNAIPESSLDTATRNLKDGRDHLKVLEKDSIAYNQQLAANVQAADQVAQAQLDVASIQRQLNIDLTNPVQVANEQVVTAKAALDKAKNAKYDDPNVRAQVVGTAQINLRNAQANAESAAFSQFLSSADTAQQLGRISHKAYLALLQGRKDQIDAEIAGLKNNDPQRKLLQDESDKLALSIKSGSDALAGVFNIGDIKTPTPYEVRKAIQDKDFGTVLGSNPASSTSGNVTNDTSTKNVVLNGVPVDTILTMIQELFGLKVRSSGGRKK